MESNNIESRTFKGYSTFDDVENHKLRTYNRLITVSNISRDINQAVANDYIRQMDVDSQRSMAIMAEWIRRNGIEEVKKAIAKEVN